MKLIQVGRVRLRQLLMLVCVAVVPLATAAPGAHASGLAYSLNNNGIASLTWNGSSVLNDGTLRIINGPFFTSDPNNYDGDGYFPTSSSVSGNTVYQTYPWGSMTVTYSQSGNTLTMAGSLTNSSTESMTTGEITFMVSNFPSIPNGHMANWASTPMDNWVMIGDPNFDPPVVGEDWGNGSIALCNDLVNNAMPAQVGGCYNVGTFTQYPFCGDTQSVPAGTTKPFQFSMRFGNTGTSDANAADIYQRYAAYYPAQLQWTDRRPIAQDVLASSPPDDQPGDQHPATNPRGWGGWCTSSGSQIDFTQPTSTVYPEFRTALLAYAADTITQLNTMGAQGVVFWDLEGEQYSQPSHTYIGDPRLITTLAPEMGYTDGSGTTINLFFQQFINAGYKVGVCIRPQQIENQVINGITMPTQEEATVAGTTIYSVLQSKIAYATSNYGATLFYTDTTVDPNGNVYDPTPFQQVTALYPNILMIPEEASARYFSFGAKFGDFGAQGVTNTDPELYNVYPGAFMNIFAAVGNIAPAQSAFEQGASHGDMLMFHGWFDDEPNNGAIKTDYDDAGHPPAAAITAPAVGASIAGTSVSISATATAASGKSISSVAFYKYTTSAARVLLATVTSSPYNYTWTGVAPGNYVIAAVATDNAGLTFNPRMIPITVTAATVPVITSSTTASGTVGTAFSYTITASNSPTSYSEVGTLPAGLSYNSGSHSITGTPTATGSTNVTIKATNASGTGSATLTITISAAGSAYTVYALWTPGTTLTNGGADSYGNGYNASLVGTSVTYNTSTFTYGPSNVADAYNNQTVTLPAGSYTKLDMVGTAVGGNVTGETFVVHYTNGTTKSFTINMSDWGNPQGYSGETQISTQASRINSTGGTESGATYIYGYTFSLNGSSVASITMPATRQVIAFGFKGHS